MRKKKRRELAFWAVLVILLAAAAGTAIWLLAPRNLAEIVDTAAPVELRVQRYDRENVELTVEPGTPEAAAVRQVLAEQSWHLCLETLIGADSLEGLGDMRISLYGRDGAELSVFSGNSRISRDGRYVRLGYWGKTRSAAVPWWSNITGCSILPVHGNTTGVTSSSAV